MVVQSELSMIQTSQKEVIFVALQKGGKMRLIDADAFGNRMYHESFEKDSEDQRWDSGCWIRYRLFEKVLEEQPKVDAVEVVRCKDCKLFKTAVCAIKTIDTDENGFCSYAERRQDES